MQSMVSDKLCLDLQSSTFNISFVLFASESEESEGEENVNALRTVDPYELQVISQQIPRKTAIMVKG